MPAVPPSTPPARPTLGISELAGVLFFALGSPRLDFFDFFVHREGVQKLWFFGIAPKRQKPDDKSKLGSPCHHFEPKNMTFEVPFGIVFSSFCEWPNIKKSDCFSIFFNGLDHQKPLIFRLIFHRVFMFVQNHSQGAFLEGPRAELLQKTVLGCNV